MKKLNFKKMFIIFLTTFLLLEFLKYVVLGYFILTDDEFLTGEFSFSYDLGIKLYIIEILPLIIFLILIILFNKLGELIQKTFFIFLGFILFKFFDLRVILFFVDNHILKYLIFMITNICLLILIFKKTRNKYLNYFPKPKEKQF